MNHLSDKQLELWLRSKGHLDHEEATYISEHLEKCHFCREKLALLKAYNDDIEREISRDPDDRERSIASKIYPQRSKNILPTDSLIHIDQDQALPKENSNSLPAKIKDHPIVSTSIAIGSILAAALLLMVHPWQNDNPTYAEVKRNVLHVYNQKGEPIWSMVAKGIPNETNSKTDSSSFIQITDIDGDHTNEILVTGDNKKRGFTQNTLYCYNADGTLRWKQYPPTPIMFGDRTQSKMLTWNISDFFVLNQPQKTPQLFATSNSSWFTSVLFKLNPSNGNILQTYWHPGWIWTSTVYKRKNRRYILLGTSNDTYQKAALVELDPDSINGHAPLTETYEPQKISRADEKHYIMFQPSILNRRYGKYLYNHISKINITENGELLVEAKEKWEKINAGGSVFYTLDKNFNVLEAHGSAKFDKIYSDLLQDGKLDKPLTKEYWESLKDSVLYWNDSTSSFISQDQLEN